MFDLIKDLYHTLITEPILNLIQFLYNLTGDTGWAILITGIIVNLAIWPLFAKSYINSQKMRVLQPQIKEIQKKYKSNPQEMLAKTREFYQKHDIKNSATFLTLILQILIISGLFFIIRRIVNDESLTGVYGWINESGKASFDHTIFGVWDIQEKAVNHIWMPILIAFMSFMQGRYNFKWSPRLKLAEKLKEKEKKNKKKKDEKTEPSMAESIQKSMEVQTMYVLPVIFFIINVNWAIGLNIYFLTSSAIGLIRQISLSTYYSKHTDKLLEDIADSDPTSKDDDPDNNLENVGKADQLASQEVPAKVIKEKPKAKTKTKKKSKKGSSKKTSKKHSKKK